MEQEVLKVRFKKLVENAVIPTYKTVGAAGMDLTATSTEFIDYGNQLKVYTGIAVEIPKGYVGLLFPRSSIVKTNNRLANCVGVIDSDYRGEIKIIMINLSKESYEIMPEERICQFVLQKVHRAELTAVTNLEESDRSSGGFGHTGKK